MRILHTSDWHLGRSFHRAGLLGAQGAWLDHLVESSVFEFVYLPVSYLRRAEIHDRMHDPKSAAADYSAFIGLWGNCDPDLRPTVDRARRKLAGLEAVAGSPSGRVQ